MGDFQNNGDGEPESPDLARLRALSYLVVDDDELSRATFKKFLHVCGCANVREADSAGLALHLLGTAVIDVLLTDFKMPDMGGDELVWCLRRSDDERLRRLPVVMISAYADKEHMDLARDAGVDEFAAKPCSPGDFCLYISRAVFEPRPFVDAKDFRGPDRRRKDKGAPGGGERREGRDRRASNIH